MNTSFFLNSAKRRLKRPRPLSQDDNEPEETVVKAKGIFPSNKHVCHVRVISSYILYLILFKLHVIKY